MMGKKYDLAKTEDREKLHTVIDDVVLSGFVDDMMSTKDNAVKDELDKVHYWISEQEEDELQGKWFDGKVEFDYYIDDITDYLDDMEIEWVVKGKSEIEFSLYGNRFLLSRKEVKDTKGYRKVFVFEDGEIEPDDLMCLEIYPEQTYYLSKDYQK